MNNGQHQHAELISRGWELLDEEKLAECKAIGEELKSLGESTGFRIVANALIAGEDLEAAARELEEGLASHPGNWELLLELATVFSDLGELEKALTFLEEAEKDPAAEKTWIELNRAIVVYRLQDFDRALNILQQIEDESVQLQAIELKLNMLNELMRHDLLLEVAEEELEDIPIPKNEDEAALTSKIFFFIANACWYENRPEEETMHYLEQAITYNRTDEDNLQLLREVKGNYSDEARVWSLEIQGELDLEEGQKKAYVCEYIVVADNEEEALEMIKEFEGDWMVQDSWYIIESDSAESDPDNPKGIYQVGEFMEIPGDEN